jgi:hypothetical protein
MLAGYLLRTLERHSDRLTDELVTDLTTNDRTPSFRHLQVDALRERARAIYGHLVDWLGQRSEAQIEATFEALGRQRFEEQIPLEELVYAIILSRQHVRDSIGRVGDIDAAIELHYLIDLHALVTLFFDRALHATVKGYEQARREPPDADRQRQKAKFGIKTSDGIKMAADLGGWVP